MKTNTTAFLIIKEGLTSEEIGLATVKATMLFGQMGAVHGVPIVENSHTLHCLEQTKLASSLKRTIKLDLDVQKWHFMDHANTIANWAINDWKINTFELEKERYSKVVGLLMKADLENHKKFKTFKVFDWCEGVCFVSPTEESSDQYKNIEEIILTQN